LKSRARSQRPLEVAPEETLPEASKPFKLVQLRFLMSEREEFVRKLVDLDYSIWVLEEYFRNESS
jgi:hypothetical protein